MMHTRVVRQWYTGPAECSLWEARMALGTHLLRHKRALRRALLLAIVTVVIALAALGARAISPQDKYTVQVPGGLAFSEFRGYEDWQTVSVIQTEGGAGIPGNGKPFPDGSKMAKIHWNKKQSAEAPDPTTVPDTLHDIDFMVRDSKRFSKTGNWGYAQFNYDAASDTFKPEGTSSDCGFACHTIVAKKDYVFTVYGKR